MSEATAETHVNGTAPAPAPDEPCLDCVTSGERILAIVGLLFAGFLAVMALDMLTGGKVGGWVKERTSG